MITETDGYWGSRYILLCFSYRGNNDVAGHAFASAREPIEQEVGVYFVSYDWYNQPIRLKLEKEYRPGGEGTLGISGWGCAAGTLNLYQS